VIRKRLSRVRYLALEKHDYMKEVLSLPESAELELIKNMLEGAGIPCALRNEQLSQALPASPFNAELWVANDEDFPRAQELCQAWLHPPSGATSTWVCAKCGQRLMGQFDSCWRCGTKRETTANSHAGEADEKTSGSVE
jgi:hypothetical protein